MNLVNNPDFKSNLEGWEIGREFVYEVSSDNKLNVVSSNLGGVVFLSKNIMIKPGRYYFSLEGDAVSQFKVQIKNQENGSVVKQYVCANGCSGTVDFEFEISLTTEVRVSFEFLRETNDNVFSLGYVCLHRDGQQSSPYLDARRERFWSGAVAGRSFFDLENISKHQAIFDPYHKFATAGSCFAQHISRHLKKNGLTCIDIEQAPEVLTQEEAVAFGYNQFSCRYGNIYTTRQLYQLFLESEGRLRHGDDIWCKAGRYYDALRPSVDPVGYSRPDYVRTQRAIHLKNVARLWRSFDVFVFTLGLTECWVSREFGTVYPTAPGTIAGCFESSKYELLNLNYEAIYSDLSAFWIEVKALNPTAKLLLTVSPVPLTATATDQHVLVATTYSKSVLRAVAGEFTQKVPDSYYFPSYEIINSHPSRGIFYDPNLRSVNKAGVDFVMRQFFSGESERSGSLGVGIMELSHSKKNTSALSNPEFEVYCDDELLDKFNK